MRKKAVMYYLQLLSYLIIASLFFFLHIPIIMIIVTNAKWKIWKIVFAGSVLGIAVNWVFRWSVKGLGEMGVGFLEGTILGIVILFALLLILGLATKSEPEKTA